MELVSPLLCRIRFGSTSSLPSDNIRLCFISGMQDVLFSLYHESFGTLFVFFTSIMFFPRIHTFNATLTQKRILGTHSRQNQPVMPDILISIVHLLNLTEASHVALWALFTAAFFSFLWQSNLVASSASTFNCDRHLARHDIKFTDSGVLLRIKWSKTRQHQESIHIIPLPSIPNALFCLGSCTTSITVPLFCLPHGYGSGLEPITAY